MRAPPSSRNPATLICWQIHLSRASVPRQCRIYQVQRRHQGRANGEGVPNFPGSFFLVQEPWLLQEVRCCRDRGRGARRSRGVLEGEGPGGRGPALW